MLLPRDDPGQMLTGKNTADFLEVARIRLFTAASRTGIVSDADSPAGTAVGVPKTDLQVWIRRVGIGYESGRIG
ncbi:unnamed protein product [Cuscuta campestris]|uniref:Uncharacterized protein n=1 Tax=Cuscuta campestris TaxID=132261 RepID=A0A484KTU8_9ASTE|nr:unnamed protein product [Cuscuta campestris]